MASVCFVILLYAAPLHGLGKTPLPKQATTKASSSKRRQSFTRLSDATPSLRPMQQKDADTKKGVVFIIHFPKRGESCARLYVHTHVRASRMTRAPHALMMPRLQACKPPADFMHALQTCCCAVIKDFLPSIHKW